MLISKVSDHSKLSFYVSSIVTVVGQNYEMADMTNPNGYLYGERYFVRAELARGNRWEHDHIFDNLDAAERLANKISHAVNNQGRVLEDVHWDIAQAVYGSDAYISDGWEDELVRLEGIDE